jgi:hypothetical protein
MEADISILRKTGHFYFALTARVGGDFVHCAAGAGKSRWEYVCEAKIHSPSG